MVGSHCASIDLPVPGEPRISTLCPPLAATTSARLARRGPRPGRAPLDGVREAAFAHRLEPGAVLLARRADGADPRLSPDRAGAPALSASPGPRAPCRPQ